MEHSAFKGRVNFNGILWGAAFVVLALVAGYGASTGWRLRIVRLHLPAWTLWVAAGIGLVVAVAFVLMSVNATFCAVCGAATVGGNAYLPLADQEQVLRAAKAGDFERLLARPMVLRNQMKMAIWAAYCPRCEQAATVQVTRWQDHVPTTVMEMTEFTGASAQAVAALVQKHEDWRTSEGEDDD